MGTLCAYCDEPITGPSNVLPHLDQGGWTTKTYHRECSLRMVIGGINHILRRCTCCGGTEPPDPPGRTRRQAALMAVVAWQRREES
jgi:hypothetical protein